MSPGAVSIGETYAGLKWLLLLLFCETWENVAGGAT